MAQFLLLLYDDRSMWEKLSPDEIQKAIEKYLEWTKMSIGGKRLAGDPWKRIRLQNGESRVTTICSPETQKALGGYFTIEAANYEEAVQRALTHPHLEYGGILEVRQVYEDRQNPG